MFQENFREPHADNRSLVAIHLLPTQGESLSFRQNRDGSLLAKNVTDRK